MKYISIFTFILSLSLASANNGKLSPLGFSYKSRFLIFFKKSALGEDIIDFVFDICDGKETGEGLSLTEVMENHCMHHLTETFGLLSEDVARDFEAIDKNGDGLVSKQECVKAYETLGLERTTGNPGNTCSKIVNFVCGVNDKQYTNDCQRRKAGIVTMNIFHTMLENYKLCPKIQFPERVKIMTFEKYQMAGLP